jgi:hypothetical protein
MKGVKSKEHAGSRAIIRGICVQRFFFMLAPGSSFQHEDPRIA